MRAILRLAFLSAWSRRTTLGLMLVSITLSTSLLLGVERLRVDARTSFTQSISGVDLVVGARSGAVQLMLYAVFHSGNATANMRWSSHESIASHPATEWAIPISLGDSHRGFSVLGTTPTYFTHFRYSDSRPLRFSSGRSFDGVFEAVVGSEVAAGLGYRESGRITLSHGAPAGNAPGLEHDDKPFIIVGVLAPTGTPVDLTVHISLESMTALHLDWVGGAPLPGLRIPPEMIRKFNLAPKEITATLVGLKQRTDVFRMQRFINTHRDEALMGVLPGVALDELWQTISVIERSLLGVSALVVLTGLAGLAATLLAGLNERRRELAILRALGAGLPELLALLTLEGLIVTTLGVAFGAVLLSVTGILAGPWLLAQYGIVLSTGLPGTGEASLIGLVIATGLLASLIPGWRAWRMSLHDGLMPRN